MTLSFPPARSPAPVEDNLKLGLNEKYRVPILNAARRSGILSQGIAALVEAEAGKIRVDGRRSSEWDSLAINPIGASGLTQFLRGAWLDLSTRRGTALYSFIAEQKNKTGNTLSQEAVLRLRFDPVLSILSAADYAAHNLKHLKRRGCNVDALSRVDLAKLAYLLHHDGLRGAFSIIRGTQSDQLAERKLALQYKTTVSDGTGRAATFYKKTGLHGAAACRKFIFDYTDRKIVPPLFALDPSRMATPLSMSKIAERL